MNSYFISFEGTEGSGKSTLIETLAEKLRNKGYKVVHTREPGGIEIAEQIRAILLDPKNTHLEARTEALLYAAARRQHLVEKVIPALNEGAIVLCDRFVDSSLVYQGIGRNLGIEEIWSINQFAIDCHMPDMTIYIDLEPEKGLARIAKNSEREVNRLDKEDLSFHKRVHEGYLSLVNKFPERIEKVCGDCTREELVVRVEEILARRLHIQ
ncbi:MAG: dTMP kinase [Bacillaceae bacterium]